MLKPRKHSHPDQTVMFMSTQLLKHLQKQRLDEYDSLLGFAKRVVTGGDTLFLPALNMLYLLGLIEYRPKTDAVEYVGPS